MGSLTNHAIQRIQKSSCPPNHILHRNRCGWLQSKQNLKEGQTLPFQDSTIQQDTGLRGPQTTE